MKKIERTYGPEVELKQTLREQIELQVQFELTIIKWFI